MKNGPWRPRRTMRKIYLGCDVGQLLLAVLFVVAGTAVVLVGGPSIKLFFGVAVPAALAVAGIMYRARQDALGSSLTRPSAKPALKAKCSGLQF